MANSTSQHKVPVSSQVDANSENWFSTEVRTATIRKAHLHPQMTVAILGEAVRSLADVVSKHVRQVISMEQSPDELPSAVPGASVDTLFAGLDLQRTPDPSMTIRALTYPIKPGGRLVMIFPQDPSSGLVNSQIQAWLAEAGLVNCLVYTLNQLPVGTASQTGAILAVGARAVAGVEAAVSENYAALAESQSTCCTPASGTASCCGDDALISPEQVAQTPQAIEQIFSKGYSASDRQNIPSQAADFSLGCGNPTAFAGLQPGEVVLDIGSGGGLDALIAARRVGPQGNVIGVDMTLAMLRRARQAAAAADIGNVEFRQGKADALPVDDSSVDVIISNCVINLTPDKGKVCEEAWRVLRPGGRLEVSDIVTDIAFPPDLLAPGSDWSSCVTGALPEEEYVDLIQQAGFSQVQVHRSQPGRVNGVNVFSAQVSARKVAV